MSHERIWGSFLSLRYTNFLIIIIIITIRFTYCPAVVICSYVACKNTTSKSLKCFYNCLAMQVK